LEYFIYYIVEHKSLPDLDNLTVPVKQAADVSEKSKSVGEFSEVHQEVEGQAMY